jgi:hypothetical protein
MQECLAAEVGSASRFLLKALFIALSQLAKGLQRN